LGLAHRLIALAAVDQRVVGTNPPSRDPVTRGAIIQALKSGLTSGVGFGAESVRPTLRKL
jgi:hypothetical protein